MLGFLTAVALTYFVVRYARRHHFGGRRMRRHRREWMLNRLSSVLNTKPSQDRVLETALDDVMDAFAEEKNAFRASRSTFADILQAEEFDATALDALLTAQKEALGRVHASVAESLEKAHGALDNEQRAQLGTLIQNGPHGHCRRRAHAA